MAIAPFPPYERHRIGSVVRFRLTYEKHMGSSCFLRSARQQIFCGRQVCSQLEMAQQLDSAT